MAYTYSLLPSALLNSVEVAKGPISTIYGPDAFHGAVAFLPEHYQANRNTARVTLGESGVEHLNALANVALDSVKLTTNLALVADEDSVIKDNQRPEGEREESYQSIGVHQGITLGDHYVGILFSEADADDMMTSNGLHYDKPGRMDRNRLKTLYYKYHYPILPEHQLRLTSWASSSYVDIVADVGAFESFLAYEDRKAGAKIHLIDEGSDALSVNYGVEYYYDKVHHSEERNAFTGIAANGYDEGEVRETASGFFDGQYALSHDLHLFLGTRYNRYSNTDDHYLSPRIGFTYDVTPYSTVKLQGSQGIRAPTAREVRGNGTIVAENEGLENEKLTMAELSYLYRRDDFRFSAALFESRWHDSISIAEVVPNALYQYINKGESSSYGVETSAITIVDSVHLFKLGAHYIKSKDEETGMEYTAFPKVAIYAGYIYEGDVVKWQLMARHKNGWTATDLDSSPKLPSYFRVDGSFQYRLSQQVSTYVSVQNLFDKENRTPSTWRHPDGQYEEGIQLRVGVSAQL